MDYETGIKLDQINQKLNQIEELLIILYETKQTEENQEQNKITKKPLNL